MTATAEFDPDTTVTRSSRDPAETRALLTAWLTSRLPADADLRLSEVSSPESNGMSSESVFFDASWTGPSGSESGSFVARLAPRLTDEPVFPRYDFDLQYRVIQLVADATDVPTPPLRWLELDESHLGVPFFVMDKVEGRVPTDIPPYALDGWVKDATPGQRAELQRSTVAAMAGIHSIDLTAHDVAFLEIDRPGATVRERHLAEWEAFADWVVGDERSPLLDHAFGWLRANQPETPNDTVVSWGDSRIGNILFEPDGFRPAAVLDWEMAALGTRDIDLGWASFLHMFFEEVCKKYLGGPGIPDFFKPEDLRSQYRELTGVDPGDLGWAVIYGAARHGAVMRRVHARSVHFGEAEWPDDRDDTILHRSLLESLIDEAS